jgi:membrane fusion protein, multidrug efflux system
MDRPMFGVLGAGLLLAALAGCERPTPQTAPGGLILPVSHPAEQEVSEFVEYTGRTGAAKSATIQARVTGEIVKADFTEGAFVKKDEVLFEIDSRPYKALLDVATAQIDYQTASVKLTKVNYDRLVEISKTKGAVSPKDLDVAEAAWKQAVASLNLANANLETAKLNYAWTKVQAPFDGIISRRYLEKGNLVNQDATQLTMIVSVDPMYAYFDMDEPTLMRIQRLIAKGEITAPTQGSNMQVQMGLLGEDDYPHTEGTIRFIDNQVNPGTGSILVRGVFPNPLPSGNVLLTPGMFVRLKLLIGKKLPKLLVNDKVVMSEQGGKFVYVVGDDGKVMLRKVTLGPLLADGLRVIQEGTKPGEGIKKDDWILWKGMQQVTPNSRITPEYYDSMPSLANPTPKRLEKKGK